MSLFPGNVSQEEFFAAPCVYYVISKSVDSEPETGERLYNIYDVKFMIDKFPQNENFEVLTIFDTSIEIDEDNLVDDELKKPLVYYNNINEPKNYINKISNESN